MNKKLFIDNFPYLIIIVVVGTYYYLNSKQNVLNQSGGAGDAKGGYPKGTPFLYQFRYIGYLLIIFLIVFNIYYAYEANNLKKITFFDTGKIFLKTFGEVQNEIKKGNIKKGSDEFKDNEEYIKSLKIDYVAYSELFCKSLAPCTCCGIGDYAEKIIGSDGSEIPNPKYDEFKKKACSGAVPVILNP